MGQKRKTTCRELQSAEVREADCYAVVLPGIATVVRLQEWGPDQLMPPLDEVSDRIMPMLYATAEAEENLDGFIRLPWIGGLCVMFVLDEDDTYRFVHEKMLEKWESCG